MRAGLHGMTMVKHHHMIGTLGVGHTMRDHDHRPMLTMCQIVNGMQNQILAFHVHAAGRLVEHIHRAIMQQRTRYGDALALPTGKIRRIRLDDHVEFAGLAVDKTGDTRFDQRVPHCLLIGLRIGHQQILAQCARKQVASGTDQRDRAGQRTWGKPRKFSAVDDDRPGIPGTYAGQQSGGRGLARP